MATTIEKPDVKSRAAAKSGQRSFLAKDLVNQVVIQGLAVSPDGASVVYVRRTVEDNKYARRLWRVHSKASAHSNPPPRKPTTPPRALLPSAAPPRSSPTQPPHPR